MIWKWRALLAFVREFALLSEPSHTFVRKGAPYVRNACRRPWKMNRPPGRNAKSNSWWSHDTAILVIYKLHHHRRINGIVDAKSTVWWAPQMCMCGFFSCAYSSHFNTGEKKKHLHSGEAVWFVYVCTFCVHALWFAPSEWATTTTTTTYLGIAVLMPGDGYIWMPTGDHSECQQATM